jgi:hypothetical protein
MPEPLKPDDMTSLFGYMDSAGPPNTDASPVVRMLIAYLKSRISGQATAPDREGKKKDFRENFFPGFNPDPRVKEESMQRACPGDHQKWASALLGQAIYNSIPDSKGLLNYDKLKAVVADMNNVVAATGTRLYIEYFRSLGVTASEANRQAYIKLLLSAQWRSATAFKQKSLNWQNASWEMYSHWVKLSACWGQNIVVERDVLADQREAEIERARLERERRRLPPPFIDERDLLPPRRDLIYDGDVNKVFQEIQKTEPKVNLGGLSDIAPTMWTTYRAWNSSTHIGYEMLGASTGATCQYRTSKLVGKHGTRVDIWNDRFLAMDFADGMQVFR